MENPTAQNANYVRRFSCEEKNADLTNVQTHDYRARQVEPWHQLCEMAGVLFEQLSSWRYA